MAHMDVKMHYDQPIVLFTSFAGCMAIYLENNKDNVLWELLYGLVMQDQNWKYIYLYTYKDHIPFFFVEKLLIN